jgi:hypothetical protein
MPRHQQWLIRWAIRAAFLSLGLGTVAAGPAGAIQSETPQQAAANEQRGALDPLTPEEQSQAERIARTDARVKQLLGEGSVRLVSAVPVIIKQGEGPEKIDVHQRTVEVVLFRPEGEAGARVVVNLHQNQVADVQRLQPQQVPFTSDDLNDAFQIALRTPEVLKALGPEAQSFRPQSQKPEPEAAAPENEVTGLPVRSTDPKDPCYRHRCLQLLFRHGTDFLSMAVDVDLSARHATLARRQSQ